MKKQKNKKQTVEQLALQVFRKMAESIVLLSLKVVRLEEVVDALCRVTSKKRRRKK